MTWRRNPLSYRFASPETRCSGSSRERCTCRRVSVLKCSEKKLVQSLVPSVLVQIPIGVGIAGTFFNADMDKFFYLLPIVSSW